VRTTWSWLKGLALFWYDFLVGDDWTIAVGVAVVLGATYGILQTSVPAWWLLPLGTVTILAVSVVRANRRS
jgi:hypothetical protein